MLLYLNILALFFLPPALSGPVPLTTPSRGCPACKAKTSQSQPSVDLNATTLAVGEPCGVYTLSCAHGLRCAPPEDEPRPLRALLEGRGVCSNASSDGPTDPSNTAGKSHTTLYAWKMMRMNEWMKQSQSGGEAYWWIFNTISPFADLFVDFFNQVTSLHFTFDQQMDTQPISLWHDNEFVMVKRKSEQRNAPVFTHWVSFFHDSTAQTRTSC